MTTRILSFTAFVLGAAVVLWMGSAFIASNVLALLVTVLIALAYSVGFGELLRYQRATDSLSAALASIEEGVDDLQHWLAQLPVSLRQPVYQRIQGEPSGLPAPVLTPYLVGLLVMLGLLGTFIGMVDTLKGAVTALEGSSELDAVRAGLAAPMHGLGMAFATSVAGVTASAMLGFIATLSRRQRLEASRALGAQMNAGLRAHSFSHQRQQTFAALQSQAEALPAVAAQLGQLGERLEGMAEQISSSLTRNQADFHHSVEQRYRGLSEALQQAMNDGVREHSRLLGESVQPVLEHFMQGLSGEAEISRRQLSEVVERQLSGLNEAFSGTAEAVATAWQQGLAQHRQAHADLVSDLDGRLQRFDQGVAAASQQLLEGASQFGENWLVQQQRREQAQLASWNDSMVQSGALLRQTVTELGDSHRVSNVQAVENIATLLARSEALVQARAENEGQWLDGFARRSEQLAETLTAQFDRLHDAQQQRGEAAVAQLNELQAVVATQLAELGQALEAPMTRLIETASETPRAAAGVIETLRVELSNSLERDNSLLEERAGLMAQLDSLTRSLQRNSEAQSEAVQSLLAGSASRLDEVGQRFAQQVDGETDKLSQLVDYFSAGSGELASLGEAFTVAVQRFGDSNQQLMDKLDTIEQALQQAGGRSDEQMAYYLAQAREIIDHNLLSHQELLSQFSGLHTAASTVNGSEA